MSFFFDQRYTKLKLLKLHDWNFKTWQFRNFHIIIDMRDIWQSMIILNNWLYVQFKHEYFTGSTLKYSRHKSWKLHFNNSPIKHTYEVDTKNIETSPRSTDWVMVAITRTNGPFRLGSLKKNSNSPLLLVVEGLTTPPKRHKPFYDVNETTRSIHERFTVRVWYKFLLLPAPR